MWSSPQKCGLLLFTIGIGLMRVSIHRGDHIEATIDLYPDTHPATKGPIETIEIDFIRDRLAAGQQDGTLQDGRYWRIDPAWQRPVF